MAEYDFSTIVRQIALKENIHNCQLKEVSSSEKGDGYTGTVKVVQLIGSNKKLDVVFKYVHRDPSVHDKLPIRLIYLREIKFYEEIVPAFASFQDEYKVKDKYDNSPIFYGSIKEPRNELLVMENLRVKNYDLWNRKQLINKAHLEYAMLIFAKFHGTSFAMQKLNPNLYMQITAELDGLDMFHEFFKIVNFSTSFKKLANEIISVFDPVMEKAYIEKLNQFAEKIDDELSNVLNYRGHDVILQGDCWCNNAMYQYEDLSDRSKPKNMKLLDLQAIRLGPPCFDLGYFFYSISPKELFDDLEYFLNVYYDALKGHLAKFKLSVEEIYPKNAFWKDWAIQSRFGFMVSFTVRKAMMSESQDAPDLSEDLNEFMSAFRVNADQEQLYKQQMKELVVHFVDNKFI